MNNKSINLILSYLATLIGIAFAVILYTRILHATPQTIVVLTFLIIVLFCALFLGTGPGLTASIIGALSYNFFFIPPVGTFTISHPQDIATFVAFAITALTVSTLSSLVARRAQEAEQQKLEIEKLYTLAKTLIEVPLIPSGAVTIADQIVHIFGLEYCGIYVPDKRGDWKRVSLSSNFPGGIQLPNTTTLRKTTLEEIAEEQEMQIRYTLLKTPKGPVGMLATKSDNVSSDTITAISSLVALALQRNRLIGKTVSAKAR